MSTVQNYNSHGRHWYSFHPKMMALYAGTRQSYWVTSRMLCILICSTTTGHWCVRSFVVLKNAICTRRSDVVVLKPSEFCGSSFERCNSVLIKNSYNFRVVAELSYIGLPVFNQHYTQVDHRQLNPLPCKELFGRPKRIRYQLKRLSLS